MRVYYFVSSRFLIAAILISAFSLFNRLCPLFLSFFSLPLQGYSMQKLCLY